MNNKKKKVFTVALVVCLIAMLSMGTVAWFNASDSVTNKFMIASSEDDTADEIFSVAVTEEFGTDGAEDPETGDVVYKDILPGDELTKVVDVKNTGHYDQFIRVTVTVTDARAWMNVLGVNDVPAISAIVEGYDSDMWSPKTGVYDADHNKFVYTLYYTDELAADQTINVFDSVKIPESMTKEDAARFNGGFDIDVVADAVQTENVGATAAEAFATVGL